MITSSIDKQQEFMYDDEDLLYKDDIYDNVKR